jgi:hypothetical protein
MLQGLNLIDRLFDDFRLAMADAHGQNATEEIQILVTLPVINIESLPLLNGERG